MKFVNVVTSDFFLFTVSGHTIPHRILNDKHTDFFQLIAEFLNIEANQAVCQVNICVMIEQILRAVYKHFKRIGNSQSNIALFFQFILQIRKQRHFVCCRGIFNKFLVNTLYAFINYRTFFGTQTVTTAHNDFTKGNQKVGFISDNLHRIFQQILVNSNIHRVDVLLRVACDTDKLSFESLHKRKIFSLRVTDNNIVRCSQKAVQNLTLNAETFTTSRSS